MSDKSLQSRVTAEPASDPCIDAASAPSTIKSPSRLERQFRPGQGPAALCSSGSGLP